MKKLITLLLMFVVLPQFAQNEFGVQVNGGVGKFTPHFIRENGVEETSKLSYLIGIYFETPLNEKIKFGTGLNYNNTESEERYEYNLSSNENGNYYYNKKMSNIGIPVYLKFLTKSKLSFDAGLRFSINVGSEMKYIEEAPIGFNIYDWKSSLNVKKVQFGAQIGMNYRLNDNFEITTLHYRDIIKLDGKNGDGVGFRSWQLHLGLKYAIAK